MSSGIIFLCCLYAMMNPKIEMRTRPSKIYSVQPPKSSVEPNPKAESKNAKSGKQQGVAIAVSSNPIVPILSRFVFNFIDYVSILKINF